MLQNRLEMAHELKLLTDSAHGMSGSELDELRLHVKVLYLVCYWQFCGTNRLTIRLFYVGQ